MNTKISLKRSLKNIVEDLIPIEGEIIIDENKANKNLSFIKVGDGKHKFSELPYEPLPIPHISNIKSLVNTGKALSYIDLYDNIFLLYFDENNNLIKYKENDDYIEIRGYDENGKLISRLSNLCKDNMSNIQLQCNNIYDVYEDQKE